MTKLTKILFLVACICGISFAQTSFTSSVIDSNTNSKQPSNTITSTIIKSSVIIGTTALLIHYDQQIHDNLYKWVEKNKAVKNIGNIITYFGDGRVSLGIYGGFVGYGLIFDDKKAIEAGKIGFESFLLANSAALLLKQLTGRERPKVATRPCGFWHGPFAFFRQPTGVSKSTDYFTSFPSGHTSTAFATATVISDFYTDSWVSYTCYSLATLVAISRVTEGSHWLSDCFVGALIGYGSAKLVEKINYGDEDISVIPWVNREQSGFIISFKLQ